MKKLLSALCIVLAFSTSVQAAALTLSWIDNSDNEDGFKIERCTGVDCTTFVQIATVGPNVVTYTDASLPERTTFGYRVRAYNVAGDSVYTNVAYGSTPATIPNAPTGLGVK